MQILLSGGNVLYNGVFKRLDILIADGVITGIAPFISIQENFDGRIIECGRFFMAPGFADAHVHLREPGFSYKATIKSETVAAAAGGYTTVCAMPNLSPAPDSLPNLQAQLDIINRDACVQVLPYGCITKCELGVELADMESMAPFVAGFSDDGRGVQSDALMELAMRTAKSLGKPIVAHCEINALLHGGYIHDGEYAKKHNMKGICSESEWGMIKRDLDLVRKTGCRYHVCHISCAESVALIRAAKAEGLPVSCETAPHYLVLCEDDLQDEGRFKMNPPLRALADKEALIKGFCDGTIDFLATDHAPHTEEEKSKGLHKSAFGVVGLETAFAAVNKALVKTGKISLETLIDRISLAPRRFLGLSDSFYVGQKADITVFDPEIEVTFSSADFLSAARSSPFDGLSGTGIIEYTVYNGRTVWDRDLQKN